MKPERIEFWQGRPNRLHDRFRYTRDGESWRIERLARPVNIAITQFFPDMSGGGGGGGG